MPEAQALFFVVILVVLSFHNVRVSGAQSTDPSEGHSSTALIWNSKYYAVIDAKIEDEAELTCTSGIKSQWGQSSLSC